MVRSTHPAFFLLSFPKSPFSFSPSESRLWDNDLTTNNLRNISILRNRSKEQDKWQVKGIEALSQDALSSWPPNRWLALKPMAHSEESYEMCQSCLPGDVRQKHLSISSYPHLDKAYSSDINCPALLNALQVPKNIPYSMCQRSF